MKRILCLCLFFIGSAFVLPGQTTGKAVATVPRLVKFSGTLPDAGGSVLGGAVGVTFALYEEERGGIPLWTETQNVQADDKGRYTAMLGSTRNDGIPAEVFASGQGRWLGVQPQGEAEGPRVLMVSVPYALKAADAETVGGLPPSAFVLAVPATASASGVAAMSPRADSASPGASPALSGSGTADFVPLWLNSSGTLGNSVLFQSGTGNTAKIGINITSPGTTLDVKGATTLRGILTLPITSAATASTGEPSQPLNLASSAYNSGSQSAISQNFRLQAEPAGNNTAATSGTLNLLYSPGSATPAETGFHIASNGQISFAAGQTFPGAGTITGVTAGSGLVGGGTTGNVTVGMTNSCASGQVLQWNGSAWACASVGTGGGSISGVTAGIDLTGGGTSGNVILNLDTSKVPQLGAANAFTANQTVNGNLTATGVVAGSSYQIGSNLFAFGDLANDNVFLGFSGNPATTGFNNTSTGAAALSRVTFGANNTANGSAALDVDTSGSNNVAIGALTLWENTTGNNNVGVGSFALDLNQTGSDNVAVGHESLNGNGSGIDNIAIGSQALYFNTVGTLNTAAGFQALYNNSTASGNTALGSSSLYTNTTGAGNTALGQSALGANTNGSFNTAVGWEAGNAASNTQVSGSNNTFIGFAASTSGNVSYSTAIGANAIVGQSHALVLGGQGEDAVTVGIGTPTPYYDYALDVEATPGGQINGGVVADSTGGNIYLGMTNGVHKFRVDVNGVVYANGGFQSSGADFAESFAVRGERSEYQPGDVLVIDQKAKRHLTLSTEAYATLVAGIYSTKPGLLASPHHIDDETVRTSEVPLAVVGIVPCKVTTENGTIAPGDLLVTSSRPGYAMKGTDRPRMLGAVVGKALEPLSAGTGVVEVLVTLQ